MGEIGRAIAVGLCGGAGEVPERYDAVQVCAGNQAVVDRSEVLIIAVRPADRYEALACGWTTTRS
ncbi:hypothetical protein ACH35V_17725 [Actinomadura sp. 1N219]|uniref:hypothetical protein n=1 Tax=Actinomadura sp. 1N219 TaxID=3375152 RepID=UPI00379EAC91